MRYLEMLPFVTSGCFHCTWMAVSLIASPSTSSGGPEMFSSGCVLTSYTGDDSPAPAALLPTTRNR